MLRQTGYAGQGTLVPFLIFVCVCVLATMSNTVRACHSSSAKASFASLPSFAFLTVKVWPLCGRAAKAGAAKAAHMKIMETWPKWPKADNVKGCVVLDLAFEPCQD